MSEEYATQENHIISKLVFLKASFEKFLPSSSQSLSAAEINIERTAALNIAKIWRVG